MGSDAGAAIASASLFTVAAGAVAGSALRIGAAMAADSMFAAGVGAVVGSGFKGDAGSGCVMTGAGAGAVLGLLLLSDDAHQIPPEHTIAPKAAAAMISGVLLELLFAEDAAEATAKEGLGTKCALPAGGCEEAVGAPAVARCPPVGRFDGVAVDELRRGEGVLVCGPAARGLPAVSSPLGAAAFLGGASRLEMVFELNVPEDSISSTARARPSL